MQAVFDIRKVLALTAAGLVVTAAYAQGPGDTPSDRAPQARAARDSRNTAIDNTAIDAQAQVDEALDAVKQMKRDPGVVNLLQRARGIFIVPDYAKAALGVGGEGGSGIALLRRGVGPTAEWSAPVFFDIGAVSAGAEAGIEAGSIAMILMSDRAADMFANHTNKFSLDAKAGLTIVNWSAKRQASAGRGDVVLWSDTEGAFAGAAIAVSDIHRDADENRAYYGRSVAAQDILSGTATSTRADELRDALADTATPG